MDFWCIYRIFEQRTALNPALLRQLMLVVLLAGDASPVVGGRIAGTDELRYFHLIHLHRWLLIFLFHCCVLLALLDDNLFTIHNIETLCGVNNLTTLHV